MTRKRNDNSHIEILIAEDSLTQAMQLETMLEKQGYTVIRTGDGEEALATARRRKPALIISDVMMPKLDGYGLCKAIKSDDDLKDIPIMLVTTLSDPRDVILGLESGADNFIRKPYEDRYLLSRISHLLMNLELRQNQKMQMGVEINLGGQKRFITADRQQILDLLISTYEQAVDLNQELKQMNEKLEQMVEDRTAELRAEIEIRKKQEARVARLNRILSVLSGINTTIVRVRERDELFEAACRIAVDDGKFVFAWIGILDDNGQRLLPVARAGRDDGYSSQINMAVDANAPDGCEMIAETLTRMKPVICNDIASDDRFDRWRKEALDRGYRSEVMLPLMLDSRPAGVFVLYASEPNVFDDEEMRLLIETAGDISFAMDHIRKAKRLNYLAYYDDITGLPNRALFFDRLQQAMIEADRHNRLVGVALLDLDRFKTINDSLGHAIGDSFLKEVAVRLTRTVRGGDTLARFSADEFWFVLADMQDAGDAERVAAKILDSLSQPFTLAGHQLFTSASLGMVLYPRDCADPEQLMRYADVAMKRVKGSGANVYRFYTDDMAVDAKERLALENALRHALEKQEFLLHYQPVVGLDSGAVVGVEALVRWQQSERGLISPAEFIPLAEETGLILQLGEWVLHTACGQGRKDWAGNGRPALSVAVNLSPRQFLQPDLVAMIVSIIKRTGMDPELLTLEITESHLMQNIEAAVEVMYRLGDLGVKFSIDDFGTGYSSLAYLKDLPINYLKIDRSFVRNIPDDKGDSTIAMTIISMAHSLDKKVIAEGVETKAQLDFLREHGCDAVQGYYFSRPVPPEQIAPMLDKGYPV